LEADRSRGDPKTWQKHAYSLGVEKQAAALSWPICAPASRSCADVLAHSHKLLCQRRSQQWVLEGDIKACFDMFAPTVPVLTEALFGLRLLPRAEQNVKEWDNLPKLIGCYISDETDAEQAADLQVALRRYGRQLETVDALIALVALRYQLIVLTTDRDFDAVPGLQRENWLALLV
jgi:tRNA(fMet)-specific endonuclease VapC